MRYFATANSIEISSIFFWFWVFKRNVAHVPFIIVNTRHSASFVSYAYAKFTTNRELIFCKICFSINTIDSPFRFLIRFFSSFLQAYIFPVARTYTNKQRKEWKIEFSMNNWFQPLFAETRAQQRNERRLQLCVRMYNKLAKLLAKVWQRRKLCMNGPTWQAHTSPNPPLPSTRYIRNVLYVICWASNHFHCKYLEKEHNR